MQIFFKYLNRCATLKKVWHIFILFFYPARDYIIVEKSNNDTNLSRQGLDYLCLSLNYDFCDLFDEDD